MSTERLKSFYGENLELLRIELRAAQIKDERNKDDEFLIGAISDIEHWASPTKTSEMRKKLSGSVSG